MRRNEPMTANRPWGRSVAGIVITMATIVYFFGTEGFGGQERDSGHHPTRESRRPGQRPKASFSIPVELLDRMESLPGDLGPLPAVPVPKENPQTPEKIELGKLLFFDPRMSGNGHWSCATCHNPSLFFADGLPRALGFLERELGRHTPTILNAAYYTSQFWDGRASSLEEQAVMPVLSMAEMNISKDELESRLNHIPEYQRRFQEVFGGKPTLQRVGMAIAAYERTLVTGDSRFDRYMRGEKNALSLEEKRGLALFIGRASCSQCHNGPNFSDSQFHNVGTRHVGPMAVDLGRMSVTKNPEDMHAFKTPTLRNIALTAPYMHDGVLPTLEEVIEFYDLGGEDVAHKSPKIVPLNLNPQEKADLVSFLKALTSEQLPVVTFPQLPVNGVSIDYGPLPIK